MLRIVLLAALLLTVGTVALPEAAASNPCQEGIVADNTHDCSGVGPCWREGIHVTCEV